MKIQTQELTGAALDCAVARAEGLRCEIRERKGRRHAFVFVDTAVHTGYAVIYSPSADWAEGGPLIERYEIGFLPPCESPCGDSDVAGHFKPWNASFRTHPDLSTGYGRTPLVAACRAIVKAKLGDEVDVPDALVQR